MKQRSRPSQRWCARFCSTSRQNPSTCSSGGARTITRSTSERLRGVRSTNACSTARPSLAQITHCLHRQILRFHCAGRARTTGAGRTCSGWGSDRKSGRTNGIREKMKSHRLLMKCSITRGRSGSGWSPTSILSLASRRILNGLYRRDLRRRSALPISECAHFRTG